MTDIVGASVIRTIASQAEPSAVPMQDFMVKNDSVCGSTIGPMMAAKAGMDARPDAARDLVEHHAEQVKQSQPPAPNGHGPRSVKATR